MIITCVIEDVEKVIQAMKDVKAEAEPAVAVVVIDGGHLQKLCQVREGDEDFNGTLTRAIDAGICTLIRRQAGAN